MTNRVPFGPETLKQYPEALKKSREIAKEHGYAVGLHGSQTYDLDLIACPWIESCSHPDDLARAISKALGWYLHPTIEVKPHGRRTYLIYSHTGNAHLDLSVMPDLVESRRD